MLKLTERQLEILALIQAKPSLTYKEVSKELGVSPSAVGKHFSQIKIKLGANSKQSMLDQFEAYLENDQIEGVEFEAWQDLHLPDRQPTDQKPFSEPTGATLQFSDSISLAADLPWDQWDGPNVVPGALDGEHAAFFRVATIILIVVGILGSVSLVLALSGQLTEISEQAAVSPHET